MGAPNGRVEIPASRILMELIQRQIADLVQVGAAEAHLPVGAELDIARGVWVLPPMPPSTQEHS